MRTLLLVMILLLAACKSNPFDDGVPDPLFDQLKTFEDIVRWGSLQKMYLFQKHDQEKPVKIPEGLGNVRVTSYQLASPLARVNETRYTQTAVIDYVLVDRQVVRRVVDYQVWVSDDEGQHWYRETPVPQFK